MDPLTHALTGATVAFAVGGGRIGRRAMLVGVTAGLLPDVDVLIRSASDPLLAIEHHRGFTHSLVFVPVGGAIAGLVAGARGHRAWSILAAMAAYLSHLILDASATFGTQLFWPFSRHRVGLDAISIIDPLFTLIAITGGVFALRHHRRATAAVVLVMLAWLGIGLVQRERASSAQERLAASRGHPIARGAVFPTVGNTIVWRAIYEADGLLHTDRIRVPWFGAATFAAVDAVPLASPPTQSAMRSEYTRFAWFADQWVARDPADQNVIGDARYSMVSDAYVPVWGIRFDRDSRVRWVDRSRQRRVSPQRLWDEIAGKDAGFTRIDRAGGAKQNGRW